MRRIHLHQQRFACHFTMLLAMVNSGWRVMLSEPAVVEKPEWERVYDAMFDPPRVVLNPAQGKTEPSIIALSAYMEKSWRGKPPEHVFYQGVHVDHGKPHSMDECDERGCPR